LSIHPTADKTGKTQAEATFDQPTFIEMIALSDGAGE
jgi:hypothetical protein